MKNMTVFLYENLQFLEVKFSLCFNRRVSVTVKSNLAKAAGRLGYQMAKVSRAQMPNLLLVEYFISS